MPMVTCQAETVVDGGLDGVDVVPGDGLGHHPTLYLPRTVQEQHGRRYGNNDLKADMDTKVSTLAS